MYPKYPSKLRIWKNIRREIRRFAVAKIVENFESILQKSFHAIFMGELMLFRTETIYSNCDDALLALKIMCK